MKQLFTRCKNSWYFRMGDFHLFWELPATPVPVNDNNREKAR